MKHPSNEVDIFLLTLPTNLLTLVEEALETLGRSITFVLGLSTLEQKLTRFDSARSLVPIRSPSRDPADRARTLEEDALEAQLVRERRAADVGKIRSSGR